MAVKDLCWCQSTAGDGLTGVGLVLSKICAGVNPQLGSGATSLTTGCQRSVLVSIHSCSKTRKIWSMAVKDLCWCQSTARRWRKRPQGPLSKICAGVNPQHRSEGQCYVDSCQRSVLVSIHSGMGLAKTEATAVKDLCWCQSTAWESRTPVPVSKGAVRGRHRPCSISLTRCCIPWEGWSVSAFRSCATSACRNARSSHLRQASSGRRPMWGITGRH